MTVALCTNTMAKIASIACFVSSIPLMSARAIAEEPASETPPATSAGTPAPAQTTVTAHASMDIFGPSYRSPGIAVALSLTPIPVDFGNLYAENIAWGAAYTTAEVALMTPMMFLVGDHMHDGDGTDDNWSDEERGWAIGLFAGYVAVKVVSGIHAGFAATDYNREHQTSAWMTVPAVAAMPGGGIIGARGEF